MIENYVDMYLCNNIVSIVKNTYKDKFSREKKVFLIDANSESHYPKDFLVPSMIVTLTNQDLFFTYHDTNTIIPFLWVVKLAFTPSDITVNIF